MVARNLDPILADRSPNYTSEHKVKQPLTLTFTTIGSL